MSPGPTFERVYLALREQLRAGRWPPGVHIEPATLEMELSASITPIRDALHRLVGERLVEAPRHNGFCTPPLTEAALRSLLVWSNEVAFLALASPTPGTNLADALGDAPSTASQFLAHIARLSRNHEHWWAMSSINDRLGPVRSLEHRVLDGLDLELESLTDAAAAADLRTLKTAIARYHRRRENAAGLLVELLQPVPRDR